MVCAFEVLSNNFLPNPKSGRTCSSKKFYFLCLSLKLGLIFVYSMKYGLNVQLSQQHLLKRISPLNWICSFVKNHLPVFYGCFWTSFFCIDLFVSGFWQYHITILYYCLLYYFIVIWYIFTMLL